MAAKALAHLVSKRQAAPEGDFLELNTLQFRLYESYVNLVAEFTMKDSQA